MKSSPIAPPIRFYTMLFGIGIATFALHEFAHWIAGVAQGYDMVATPNHVGSRSPMSQSAELIVSASGPLITILQALLGYAMVRRNQSLSGFAWLYMAFFMRLVAAGISVFNPNDEARVSAALGIGTWTLPIIVVAGLFALVALASRRLGIGARTQLLSYVVASVVVSLIVGVDALFWGSP